MLSAPQLPLLGGCRTPNSSQPDPGHSMGTPWTDVVCNSHRERHHSLLGPNSPFHQNHLNLAIPVPNQDRTEKLFCLLMWTNFGAASAPNPLTPSSPLQSIPSAHSWPAAPRQPGDTKGTSQGRESGGQRAAPTHLPRYVTEGSGFSTAPHVSPMCEDWKRGEKVLGWDIWEGGPGVIPEG